MLSVGDSEHLIDSLAPHLHESQRGRYGREGSLQGQHHRERCAFAHGAGHVDAAVVVFDNATGEGEA
jgi:hypothetical protein